MISKRKYKQPRDQLQLNLFENSVDYVLSAAEHASKDSSRNWKYAILHLVAGIELLIKARLQIEHWSLLFSQVDKASTTVMTSGNFHSVDFETACNRLQNIAGVTIDKNQSDHLNKLRILRNRIQHFDVELDIETVKSLIAKGLNFVLEFHDTELKGQGITDTENRLEQIHLHVREFSEFVSERLQVLQPKLEEWESSEGCPACWQETLIIGDGDPRCLFCGYTIPSEEMAEQMAEFMVEVCPECQSESFAFVLFTNEDGGWLCTSCGIKGNSYERCPRCDNFMSSNAMFCDSCTEWIHEKG